jgi:hypothetical protein
VGEVQDVEDAEHQRQPDRQGEEQAAESDTVQDAHEVV